MQNFLVLFDGGGGGPPPPTANSGPIWNLMKALLPSRHLEISCSKHAFKKQIYFQEIIYVISDYKQSAPRSYYLLTLLIKSKKSN